MQARWAREHVRIEGEATEYVPISDEGQQRSFFFCPRCGATVYYWSDPEHIAVPVGPFADPNVPSPRVSVWEERMHLWVRIPEGIGHIGRVFPMRVRDGGTSAPSPNWAATNSAAAIGNGRRGADVCPAIATFRV